MEAACVAAPMRKLCALMLNDESEAWDNDRYKQPLNRLEETGWPSSRQNKGPGALPRTAKYLIKQATGQCVRPDAGMETEMGVPIKCLAL